MLNRYFQLKENSTTPVRELLAGLTTFLTMAYILFVQPNVLTGAMTGQPTGMDAGAVLLATGLSAALATAIMGLVARYPIALAPGMGQNFLFVAVAVKLNPITGGNGWQTALAIVLIAGLLFLLISLCGIREMILDALSNTMRLSIAVGIGLFIAFIGLRNGGVIVIGQSANPIPQLNVAGIFSASSAVFWGGLLVTAVLTTRRVPGAIIFGIVTGALLAWGLGEFDQSTLPASWFGLPDIHKSAIFKMDLTAVWHNLSQCLPYILIFFYMDIFDTTGTLVGIAEEAGFMKDGQLPRARQAFMADALGSVGGACLGTSTVTCYIESAAGVEQGGRTGLTALTVAVLFLLALFCSPLIVLIGSYAAITAPALVIVGTMMARNVTKFDWQDPSEAIPGFLVMLGIPLCYSIADGIALGLISYPVIKLLSGKGSQVKWMTYVLAGLLLCYFYYVGR
ncbi:MAG: NCS2 family permease [Planctomycetales bacterium]